MLFYVNMEDHPCNRSGGIELSRLPSSAVYPLVAVYFLSEGSSDKKIGVEDVYPLGLLIAFLALFLFF